MCVGDEDADAERGGEGQDHRARSAAAARRARAAGTIEDQRRRRAASSGMISWLSRVGGLAQVVLLRGRAADERRSAARLLGDRAQLGDLVQRLRSSTGRACSVTAERTPAAPSSGSAHLADERRSARCSALATAGAFARSGDDHVGRRRRAGREVAREHLLALDGLDLAAERVAAGQAGVEVERGWRRARAARSCR